MADDRRPALSVGELALLEPLRREQQRVRFNIRSTARRRRERVVVPTITSLDLDPAIAPGMVIKGTGFVRGGTSIEFDGVAVVPGLIVSVTCNLIQLATRPTKNIKVEVRTAGGRSNAAA